MMLLFISFFEHFVLLNILIFMLIFFIMKYQFFIKIFNIFKSC